jgi:predicted SnoaL-like aldol condensation-catalyzing enzyme
VVEIQQALGDFVDVSDHNMFYDPETKKIFVFDLHRLSDEKS